MAGVPSHVARLYRAVENYVLKNNGTVVVIGGIQVMTLPEEGAYKYRIAVQCVGTKPTFKRHTGDV